MQGLSEADREKIFEYHRKHGEKHHPLSVQALGWDSKDTQFRLFNHFLRIVTDNNPINLPGASILDIGCGHGDFGEYIQGLGFGLKGKYTGIDLLPEHIDIAQRRFPEAEFIQGDYLETEVPKADLVICVGGLNLKFEDNMELVRRMHEKMRQDSRWRLAFDLIYNNTDNPRPEQPHLHYFSERDICETIATLPGIVDTNIFDCEKSRHGIFAYSCDYGE